MYSKIALASSTRVHQRRRSSNSLYTVPRRPRQQIVDTGSSIIVLGRGKGMAGAKSYVSLVYPDGQCSQPEPTAGLTVGGAWQARGFRFAWLVLPQRPVTEVVSVAVIVFGRPTVTTGWVWDGLDRVWLGSLGVVVNLAEDLHDAIRAGVTVAE